MKPKKHPANLPPIIKGVLTEEVLALWEKGDQAYGAIQRRYPSLTWADIDTIVQSDRYAHVQAGLAEGRTYRQIAEELECSSTIVWAIKKKMKRNVWLRTVWGGLSPRAVGYLKKLGYKTLLAVQKDPPTEEKVFMTKGVGICLFREIQNVVTLKPGERPLEIITRPPAPWIKMPRQSKPVREEPIVEPMMYVAKASHYKGALNNPAAPEPARQLARFFDSVVKFAQIVPLLPDEMLPSDVPCMAGPSPRRWCLGVVDIFWGHNPLRVHWECPLCGKKGVVTDVDAPPLSAGPLSPGERLQ